MRDRSNEKREERDKRRESVVVVVASHSLLLLIHFATSKGDRNISICCLFRRKSHSEPLVNQVIAFAAQEEAEGWTRNIPITSSRTWSKHKQSLYSH